MILNSAFNSCDVRLLLWRGDTSAWAHSGHLLRVAEHARQLPLAAVLPAVVGGGADPRRVRDLGAVRLPDGSARLSTAVRPPGPEVLGHDRPRIGLSRHAARLLVTGRRPMPVRSGRPDGGAGRAPPHRPPATCRGPRPPPGRTARPGRRWARPPRRRPRSGHPWPAPGRRRRGRGCPGWLRFGVVARRLDHSGG